MSDKNPQESFKMDIKHVTCQSGLPVPFLEQAQWICEHDDMRSLAITSQGNGFMKTYS